MFSPPLWLGSCTQPPAPVDTNTTASSGSCSKIKVTLESRSGSARHSDCLFLGFCKSWKRSTLDKWMDGDMRWKERSEHRTGQLTTTSWIERRDILAIECFATVKGWWELPKRFFKLKDGEMKCRSYSGSENLPVGGSMKFVCVEWGGFDQSPHITFHLLSYRPRSTPT